MNAHFKIETHKNTIQEKVTHVNLNCTDGKNKNEMNDDYYYTPNIYFSYVFVKRNIYN